MATMPNATSPVSEASPSKADELPATACSSDYANNKQSSSLPEMHSNSHSSNDTTEGMETKYDDSLTGAAHADGTTELSTSTASSGNFATTAAAAADTDTLPTPPTSITSSNDNKPLIDSVHQPKIPARSRPCIVSRTSSLGFKSISSGASSSKQHAYFASSEEESEAELDEKDSHSSRASNKNYVPKLSSPSTMSKGSSLRGSKKLTEIASMSHHSQQQEELHAALLHNSRIGSGQQKRMSSSEDSGSEIAPIYKSALPSHGVLPVPPPPQTVTVALGKDNNSVGHTTITPSASGGVHTKCHSPSSAPKHPFTVTSTSSPVRKRKRNNKKDRCHSHKHLPRGLPVFKDSRSCMWTSTYDANAPSEDRYSSLVNVLLRPPKTPRKCSSSCSTRSGSEVVVGGGSKLESNAGKTDNETHNEKQHAAEMMVGESGAKAHAGSHDVESNERSVQEQVGAPATGGGDGKNHHSSYNNPNDSDDDDEDDDDENTALIRLSLWSVIDGHGGGCVATYAAEVLLPHIAASVARALKSEIVDRGVCNVNGQLRDANALDLDGLIRSSDRSKHVGKVRHRQREAGIDAVNPNSIHYRSPYEDSESGNDEQDQFDGDEEEETRSDHLQSDVDVGMRSESESEAPGNSNKWTHGESVSSVKTSLKTAISPNTQHAPMGTHSPAEVAAITRAITDSFLSVDEGWINSIDPVTTHQTSCVSNGRWNAGACALIVFIVQRLDWCRFSIADNEIHHRERGVDGFDDTSHNRDAARRRKLDYAGKSKSVSSLSTLSSTSSITTEANITENMLVEESEITETEDDDDVSDIFGQRRLSRKKGTGHHLHGIDNPHHQEGNFIATPAGCKCHYYRPHDAMLYTAHVGDCRAVMLGSAPPRTIKVPPEGDSNLSLDHTDTSEDESSSESVADEISSSEHDSDSSGDDDDHFMRHGATGAGSLVNHALGYVRKRRRREDKKVIDQPFIPLPPLNRRDSSSEESAIESDDSASTTSQDDVLPVGTKVRGVMSEPRGGGVVTIFNDLSEEEKFLETEDEDKIKEIRSVRSGSPTQMDRLPSPSPTQLVADPVHPPPLPLSMQMRPIDLTTDHSAYNPAEVTAVLRRCNNAPKAISAASSGGIKRVAGSLAVTRALGDAYLKTPRLSFFPYKRHAPYITARPEVNCRILTKGADRILTLASDGVWERASGDDVLRWVRNYYNSRIAGVKEQHLLSMYDMEDEDHDVYGEASRRNRLLTEKALQSTGISTNTVAAFGIGCASSGKINSEVNGIAVQETAARLTTLSNIDDIGKKPGVHESAASASGNDTIADSDATTSFDPIATSNSLDESTTTAKMSSKRKYPDSNTFDDSVSSRSGSTASSQGRGVATSMTSMRRHYYSSSRSPYSLPTVSDVIVHKVLNKVRKTRNISSLRMLMSLPKGRARRSKHDDITATVVDLDYFI
ncbi:hypothetical protein ACHAXH_009405 [Discostella pseudostelligera]